MKKLSKTLLLGFVLLSSALSGAAQEPKASRKKIAASSAATPISHHRSLCEEWSMAQVGGDDGAVCGGPTVYAGAGGCLTPPRLVPRRGRDAGFAPPAGVLGPGQKDALEANFGFFP